MERKKVSTTVYITVEQSHHLKLLNQRTKVPIAEFIREGIDLVLERYKDHLPGQMLLLEELNKTDLHAAFNAMAANTEPA
jgi:predicted DNA-binding protein